VRGRGERWKGGVQARARGGGEGGGDPICDWVRVRCLTDQLRDHTGQNTRPWVVRKQLMRAAPRFCVCALACHLHLQTTFPLEKLHASRREIGGPVQPQQAEPGSKSE
jgi:hypothetical protein